MLPRFIVIGAMKAGTTSLFHYLADHPQVFLHPRKELGYFAWPEEARRPEKYEAFFAKAPAGAFCGDVSTQYTKYPQFAGVPERIAELVGDARLVYLVRNPVRRVISHYHHMLLVNERLPPIDEAVRIDPLYVAFSRYRMQLSHYEPHFPREQILVVVLEEFLADKKSGSRRIFEHIGCDPSYVPRTLGRRANESATRVVVTRSIRAIQGSRMYHRVQYRLPQGVKDRVVRLLGGKPPPLLEPSRETLDWVKAQVRDDAAALASYLGRSTPIWDLGSDESL